MPRFGRLLEASPLKLISAFIFESILPKFTYDEGDNI